MRILQGHGAVLVRDDPFGKSANVAPEWDNEPLRQKTLRLSKS